MIEGKKVLAVIAARGGSKGLPRKNILDVGGRPLLAWSIEAARKSKFLDRFVLSSDDDEIIRVGGKWDCEAPCKRPHDLAGDKTPLGDVLVHMLEEIKEPYDYIVLLQPTSPLRTAEDIDHCIELCHKRNAPACVSVSVSAKSPYWMFRVDDVGKMTPFLEMDGLRHQRQNLPTAYAANGAVYVAEIPWFRENMSFYSADTVSYVMPPERSVDVDTGLDLLFVEAIMAAR